MYKQLMYGDEPGNIVPDVSDTDISVARPVPKNNTPVAYDSSSEDGVLNDRIAKRRAELGVFEKSKTAKSIFVDSDSESEVQTPIRTRGKNNAAKKSGNATTQRRLARAKHILSKSPSSSPSLRVQSNIQKPKKKTKLQLLAKPKKAKKPSQISTSPFTEFPTPTKGGVKLKKKVRTALQVQQA